MESSASITATTPAECADFSVTTATLSSVTERPREHCWLRPITYAIEPDEVVEIIPCGVEDVYDLQIDRTENFIANGLVSHNTRWHEQDLAGKILEGEDASDWTCIDLPAICDNDNDPLGRKPGEALWPLRYGRKALEKIRRAVGERVWWSLFMQKPRPLEGGVWKWPWIIDNRISPMAFRGVDLTRTVVAVDQAGGEGDTHDETGIIGAGRTEDGNMYVLADRSANMGADTWGHEACRLAIELKADAFVVEDNYGGDQSAQIIRQAWRELAGNGETKGLLIPRIIPVHAKQGKKLRAEPIAQLASQTLIHHVGEFPRLEGQLVTWIPGMDSPDRMDAYVHALTELADPMQEGIGTQHYKDQRLAGRR